MNEDKHLEIRVRVSMFGHSGFSHLSGILWECGTAERSGASTALVARRSGVRYGGAKRGKYLFECPNASSGEKNMATCVAETRAHRAEHSIWAFIPIHVDLPISSFPFFLSLLSNCLAR